jgi:hypothetical protein
MNNLASDIEDLSMNAAGLAGRLERPGYAGWFQGADENAVHAIWIEPGMPEQLARLADDPREPELARFLAAEILFRQREVYPSREQKPGLAIVYANALARNFTGMANHWGLPDFIEGPIGQHVEALGTAAIPGLAGLLDDNSPIYYAGSKEATTGNSYGYRVRDLAAYYIGKIRGIPLEMEMDPRKRDVEIEKLKSSL